MTNLVAPIHIGTLNGKPLRFFKAPTEQPNLVWHAWDDLVACAGLPRDMRERFRQSLRQDYAEAVRTIATADGIVTIAPHWMAQGFVGSMIECRRMPPSCELAYTIQSVDAWNALTSNLSEQHGMELFFAAFRNTNGLNAGGGRA